MLNSAIVLKASIRNCQIMSSRVNVETRATIKFWVKLGITPTYGKMTAANMNYKVSIEG